MCQLEPNAWLQTNVYLPDRSQAQPSCEPGAFNSRGSTGPIFIVPLPTRTLAAHFSGRTTKVVHMHKNVGAIRKSVRCSFRSSGITRSPHNEGKEKKKGKNMSATDTKKATAATSENIDEAMRSYEKALKSGIHLQEAFVETFNRTSNQTIDLFDKTLGVYQATSVPGAQRRVQDLIESSLSALRVNVHSALNTNAKIVASWKELVDRFGPPLKLTGDYVNNTSTIYNLHQSNKDIIRRLWLKQKRTAQVFYEGRIK